MCSLKLRLRRWVMSCSIIMLLLCQTMAVSLTYAGSAMQTPAKSAVTNDAPPCHHDSLSAGDNAPANDCPARCPSRDASFETAKINIPAANLAALPAYAVAPPTSTTMAAPREPIIARAAPPPLRLLYCRLLN